MENQNGSTEMTDYFLRSTAHLPSSEIKQHEAFDKSCQCQPAVEFREIECWWTITHQQLETEDQQNQQVQNILGTISGN